MIDNPITRKEKYLAKLTGSYTGNVPDPITRVEKYLYDLCQKGISGLTPEEIENAVNKYLEGKDYVTKTDADKAYQPAGSYLSGTDEELTVSGKAADAKAVGNAVAKIEGINYTDRGTLADTDAFLINDGTGMKKSVLSKLSDFVLNKIADKVFEKLQTNDKTILGAINELNIIIGANNAAAHNAIYRGKNLGTQFTAEMSANIKNGTFKDLYCGDYLVINGTTYRFMDFDYLYKTGDTSLDTHHILVVPDAPMYSHVMNDTNTTEGGYVGSKMYKSGLDQALAKIKVDFGEAHIVTYINLLVDTVSNGAPSNWAWYSRQIDLMNEEMVYGTRAWSQASQNGFDTGTNKSQLAAFQHNHSLISSCRSWYWLRAVRSSTDFCFVYGDGRARNGSASDSGGVRPCFLIS
jgi:hypothetical protein